MRKLRHSLLVLAAGLAACSGGSDSPAPAAEPPPPAPPGPAPPPSTSPAVAVQRAYVDMGFSNAVSMKPAPNDATRWFVVERAGVIRVFDNDASVASSQVFVDISARVNSGFSESGLLGFAFHPNFPGVPEVFLSYTATNAPLESRVSRFTSLDGGQTLEPASEQVLLTVLQNATNHNGGDLGFDASGDLYAAFGDGGGAGDPNNNAQDPTNLLGTIVRIDPDGGSPYGIPASNPFSANSASLCTQGFGGGDCPEIFAWGLRNPWRMSFDSATGTLWAGDVGQGSWEEVDRIEAGNNYGWREREGAHCFDPPSGCATTFTDPISEYDRTVGQSITGGYVYRGSAVPDLVGWYVFADYVQGRIMAIPADAQTLVEPTELVDTSLLISAFAEDVDGELYVLDYRAVGGGVHQIVEAP